MEVGAPLGERFRLDGRSVVITGGAGLLGREHALAVAGAGGRPFLLDIDAHGAASAAKDVTEATGAEVIAIATDITSDESVRSSLAEVVRHHGRVDALVNNASRNPTVGNLGFDELQRFETFPGDAWAADIAVGLTGAFLCAQVFGTAMADGGGGVIVNVASDLGVVAPDQRIYRQPGRADHEQPTKPVSYSVVKHGIIGLTKYLATYWADHNVRANTISPGPVAADQPPQFVERLTNLIPLGRMADRSEYRGALVFLLSDASSYMNGANLVIDGGRSTW